MNDFIKTVLFLFVFLMGFTSTVYADAHGSKGKLQDYMPSLITQTPLEGRMLAITMVRKTIGMIQRDPEIKQAVRNKYQDDPTLLMRAAELVAIEFQTIAIANNYWR